VGTHLVAVYGTLRRGGFANRRFGLDHAPLEAQVTIDGRLYDLGGYPGFVHGDGEVIAEVYRVSDAVLDELDTYEGVDVDDPGTGLYRREIMAVEELDEPVWVYVFNGSVAGRRRIEGGDWHEP
jgi:gamma-glutamylcyclotransferase (GGCT)/AIG2-like uncharacterized protein YtfP